MTVLLAALAGALGIHELGITYEALDLPRATPMSTAIPTTRCRSDRRREARLGRTAFPDLRPAHRAMRCSRIPTHPALMREIL
jgi:hypothetical protein